MDKEFSNLQVNPASLPTVDEIHFTGLHRDHLNVNILSNVLLWFVICTIAIIIHFTTLEDLGFLGRAITAGVLGISMIISFTILILGHKRKLYAIREKDVMYKKGLIWRTSIIIPFNRVQHAEVHQGPLDRLFSLSQLKVYTAGGSSSDLIIPGLRPHEANKLKHFILTKTSSDEEE